jgi:hypothetical protein
MENQFFIGIDISKATLDAALCQAERPDHYTHRNGDPAAVRQHCCGLWEAAFVAGQAGCRSLSPVR